MPVPDEYIPEFVHSDCPECIKRDRTITDLQEQLQTVNRTIERVTKTWNQFG